MLHFDDIVFGPIFSRRLGSSLGVNVLPSVNYATLTAYIANVAGTKTVSQKGNSLFFQM